jgi:hypothetical protein
MKNIILLAIVLMSATLMAQKPISGAGTPMNIGRLYGKVMDPAQKLPVAYASITVLKTVISISPVCPWAT